MKTLYPIVYSDTDLLAAYKEMSRLRQEEDLPDFTNLNQTFVSGRSTQRVPSSATDVLATDRLGDVVADATYEYKLLNISGTLKWDRRTLNTGW